MVNKLHENPKYLPGVPLGDNVVATPDLEDAVAGADILVMCAPHQFMRGICQKLVGKVRAATWHLAALASWHLAALASWHLAALASWHLAALASWHLAALAS